MELIIPTYSSVLCKKKTLFGDTKKVADVVAKEEQTGVAGYVSRQLDQDIHASVKESEYVSAIHDNAEKFDPRTEEAFKYVQVKLLPEVVSNRQCSGLEPSQGESPRHHATRKSLTV